MRAVFLVSFLLAAQLSAQDGAQLYTTYCSACHGPDGKGAAGANFPPLAGSPWLAGSPDRATKVALHGLEGPLEILGKSYNLAMPPQGAVLSDELIASILTHVRSSFGNKESAVSPDLVKKLRAETSNRITPWSAAELLQLHPLPVEPSALKNLISRTYFGPWKDLPDFSRLTAANVEEEHDGIISLDQAVKRGEHFGLVWEAEFEAKKDGSYEFYFDADDGGRVTIDGQKIAEITGLGPMNGGRSKIGKVKLTKGLHPIRIEYYEVTQNEGIQLGWKGPGMNTYTWVSKETAKNTKKWPEILLEPKDRPVIYRNFIAGTSPRAIGVGFPGGVNLAWSADHLGPELVWIGKFMDAGRHWTDRGQGNEPPAGERIVKLANQRTLPEPARFLGYKLDAAGNPTFRVLLGNGVITDSWAAVASTGSMGRPPALIRNLELSKESQPVELLLSDLHEAQPDPYKGYSLGGQIFVNIENATPEIRDGKTYLTLTPAKPVKLRYHWGF